MDRSLRACCVIAGDSQHMGYLYFQNERVVVLLNNLVDEAYLGPLRTIRRRHIEPEADILILPRSQVDEIKILERIE